MKFEDKIFLVLFAACILTLVISFSFMIKERVSMGCWNNLPNEYEETESFLVDNYSCEELREMILLDIYPTKLKSITNYYLCNGEPKIWKGKNITTEKNFEAADFKQQYKEDCLIAEKGEVLR